MQIMQHLTFWRIKNMQKPDLNICPATNIPLSLNPNAILEKYNSCKMQEEQDTEQFEEEIEFRDTDCIMSLPDGYHVNEEGIVVPVDEPEQFPIDIDDYDPWDHLCDESFYYSYQ
tara:strand:+ start:177 stop:521 length:345 start_codon:yes stop_codon:yes gene_type:complete